MDKKLANLVKGVLQFVCAAGFIVTISLLASATDIPIANYSFQNPALADGNWIYYIPSWTISGHGGAGVWNPKLNQTGGFDPTQAFIDGIPDGDQVAWSNGGDIEQGLTTQLTEGYKYTLTVWIGGRHATYSNNPYAVILAGDSILLADAIGVNLPDSWIKETVTYTAFPGDSNAGRNLKIKLMNHDGVQVNFDKVTLDESLVVTCQGFLPPFDKPLVLKGKDKRAIPVKMVLRDLWGNMMTDAHIAPPVVQVSYQTFSSDSIPGYEPELLPPGLSDDGNEFRYNPDDEMWVINLATKQFTSAGIYTVTVISGDNSYVIEGCGQTFTRNQ